MGAASRGIERDPFIGLSGHGIVRAGRFHVLYGDHRGSSTALLLHFMTCGTSRGERGVLITEAAPEVVLRAAKAAGAPLAAAIADGRAVILHPQALFAGDKRTPSDALRLVEQVGKHLSDEAGRIAIDPIETLLAGGDHPAEASFITTLLGALDDLGGTVLAAVTSAREPEGVASAAERFAHARLVLSAPPHAGDSCLLEVVATRGAGDPTRAFQISFGSTGIHCARLDDEPACGPRGPRAPESTRLLVVDPNAGRVGEITAALDGIGSVSVVGDHQEAAARLAMGEVSALLVDLYSGGGHAYQLVARARESGFGEPILLLCPRGTRVLDRVRGLRAGADDIIERPVHPDELKARVEALLRRGPWAATLRIARLGDEGFGEILRREAPSAGLDDHEATLECLFANEGDAGPVVFADRFAGRLLEHLEHAVCLGIQFSTFIAKFYEDGEPIRGETARTLQELLLRATRGDDLVLRASEGEFAAILLGADKAGLGPFRGRLQRAIETHFYHRINDEGLRLQCRVGSATWPENAPNRVPAEILEALLRSYAESCHPLDHDRVESLEAIVQKIPLG